MGRRQPAPYQVGEYAAHALFAFASQIFNSSQDVFVQIDGGPHIFNLDDVMF
jgi:hypothetical protein